MLFALFPHCMSPLVFGGSELSHILCVAWAWACHGQVCRPRQCYIFRHPHSPTRHRVSLPLLPCLTLSFTVCHFRSATTSFFPFFPFLFTLLSRPQPLLFLSRASLPLSFDSQPCQSPSSTRTPRVLPLSFPSSFLPPTFSSHLPDITRRRLFYSCRTSQEFDCSRREALVLTQ